MLLATPLAGWSQELAPERIAGAKTVSATEIVALIQRNPDLVIIDNRRAEDFNGGHIEGSIRLIDTDITNPETLERHVKRDQQVLFLCNGPRCGRAAKAAERAVTWGWKNVFYYYAGMEDWRQQNLPLATSR
jgi:rhodanese-related sulfurtransferase